MLFLHRLPTIFLFIFCSLVGCRASATEAKTATQTSKLSFEQAVHLFQTKNFEEAKNAFVELRNENPSRAELSYNIGMCELSLGHKGIALGWFRRAIAQNPWYSEAHHASDFLQRTMNISNVSHRIVYLEKFRATVIDHFPSIGTHIFTLLLGFFAGYSWLKLFGRRRIARQEELVPPDVHWKTVSLTILFIASLILSGIYLYESRQARATVIGASTAVLTTPERSAATLVELGEGMEVLIKRKIEGWAQVNVPGGPTGWIESKNLFQTTSEDAPGNELEK